MLKSSKRRWVLLPLAVLSFLGLAYWLVGRVQYRLNVMDVEEYAPVSSLKVPEHPVTRARYPFVDVHNHQWLMPVQDLDALVAEMDALNMAVMVDFEQVDAPDWPQVALSQLETAAKQGASGLKVYKGLGLTDRDASGKRIAVDDPRLAPIWDRCGELGFPVLIHSGEPAPFWLPKDKHNERWLELKQEPSRYRSPDAFPSFEAILTEQHNVFRRHPKTRFINAHLGWLGNDLGRLGKLLDELPNVYTELGAVLAELGRQPRFARDWMIRYQDRVLFGKDTYEPNEYHVYFRVLETADEYFDYYRKRHAHWKIYGLELPDEVLRKVYYGNALTLFPGIDRSLFQSSPTLPTDQ